MKALGRASFHPLESQQLRESDGKMVMRLSVLKKEAASVD
jgi:hypothetical protein